MIEITSCFEHVQQQDPPDHPCEMWGYENDGIFDWSQASATESTANAELQKQVGSGGEKPWQVMMEEDENDEPAGDKNT